MGDGVANDVANWVLPAQGFVDRRSDLQTPHLRIRMPKWIYPNPTRALTPPVAHRCPPPLEKRDEARPYGCSVPPGSLGTCWEDRIAKPAVLREARPAVRAAFHSRSRKAPAWTAPEVPSISETPLTSTMSPWLRTAPAPKRGSQGRALRQLGHPFAGSALPDTFGTDSRTGL